ncbi:lipoprotein [Streptomyces europaeiscabiei]|uniref:Lipoprotein n=1 Tax=Streptomyces europaeiscabiei TaxID=146819 RepID=A0ABU4NPS4_9ACTN|nr:lipoprotein [Streptomyces europaeiscabiei]MDX2523004.1 lipoprotein [Streptomyces europaeiscabiei]MDX2766465.1 lipoprotein [Streptomyces europaeiscabiei]MDX2775121.1 lipoprotein [Streptomyces europaeiscabiei]MDX3547246.1 lipoprotein [Streptomyces europaeiscabiei]MDX3556833.1 lipoprotein [Streptomyces europaeiscabiei]
MTVGRAVRGTVLAQVALLAGVLTGCSGSAEDGDAKPSASATKSVKAEAGRESESSQDAVESGGSVGAAGSACELPVTFDTAEKWRPEAVETGAPDGGSGSEEDALAAELAEGLLHQGPFTAACEIDAKPAGNLGFLRVWTGEAGAKDGDAEALLKEFVAAEGNTSKAEYSEFSSDSDVSGTEVTYLYTSEALEETKKERAFVTVTPDGPVVVHLGGLDTQEHEEMLPAYELAKRTLSTA